MLTVKNMKIAGLDVAIRGMRNPMNSWDKSDSMFDYYMVHLGNADLKLMKNLFKAGTDHSKFMRMVSVWCDITAPLYFWKEYDTYKMGTVANSCSTMHKIHSKPFEMSDFSVDHCTEAALDMMQKNIDFLETIRQEFVETKDKNLWYSMIQLLPESYNQMRTCTFNYENLAGMYYSRRNHKLAEWHTFCDWALELPYFKELLVQNENEQA